MSATPEISVVVATCDRAGGLRSLLQALRHQTYERFEVVIVQGPCTDDTALVLEQEAAGRVKLIHCGERNVSQARNLGVAASAGELVALIDDDAVPGSGWLAELAAAFADPGVGGAGGRVYDRDGFGLQSRFAACDRLGRTRLDLQEPVEPVIPGADPFPYLCGTNMCFRRSALEAVGGFDVAFPYHYDEVDLCVRLVDAGVRMLQLDGAPVIHGQLSNRARSEDRAPTGPGQPIETRAIFALRHGEPVHGERAVLADLDRHLEEVLDWARMMLADGRMSPDAYDRYASAARGGMARGRATARDARPPARLPEASREPLLPYIRDREEGHLRVCFVSRDLPPDPRAGWPADLGGVARSTRDLATGFATAGHEVHLVTGADDASSLSWQDGMWVHRLAPNPRGALAGSRLSSPTIAAGLEHAVGVWHEVNRTLELGPLDVVAAPLYLGEGLVCCVDPRVPVVTTLHTTLRTVASMHPSWAGRPEIEDGLDVECVTLAHARHVHASTEAAVEAGGAAARRRFETASDLPVVVRRLADAYREVARAGSGLERGATVEEGLAAVIGELGLSFGSGAQATTRALLDRRAHPIDWPQAVLALADADAETFVGTLYERLAGRPPSLAVRARHLAALARGTGRPELVRSMAWSEAAVRRHGRPVWLANLPPLPPASPSRRFARAVARRALKGAYRLSQRSGAYAVAVQVIRAQTRAVVAEALEEIRSSQRAQAEEDARERARLAGEVRRLQARVDELSELRDPERQPR